MLRKQEVKGVCVEIGQLAGSTLMPYFLIQVEYSAWSETSYDRSSQIIDVSSL